MCMETARATGDFSAMWLLVSCALFQSKSRTTGPLTVLPGNLLHAEERSTENGDHMRGYLGEAKIIMMLRKDTKCRDVKRDL